MREKRTTKSILKWVLRIGLIFIGLFIALLLFVRSEWGQKIIITKVTDYISERTNTKVALGRLYVTFSGNIYLEEFYLEDRAGDTLAYVKELKANLPIRPLIFGKEIVLKSLDVKGLVANVRREANIENFNFSFLITAFESEEPITPKKRENSNKIEIGTINFSDFTITFRDDFLGIVSRINLGRLSLDARLTDFEAIRFNLDDFELENAEVYYKQTEVFPVSQDTTETQNPFFYLKKGSIKNVKAHYEVVPENLLASFYLNEFNTEKVEFNLAENNFGIATFELANSTIFLNLPKSDTAEQQPIPMPESEFSWPQITSRLDTLTLSNNKFTLKSGTLDVVNNSAMKGLEFTAISMQAKDLLYEPGQVRFNLESMSFEEAGGFYLKDFTVQALADNQSAQLTNVALEVNKSSLNGSLSVNYTSLETFIQNPGQGELDLRIPNFQIDIEDIVRFNDSLAQNPYVIKAREKPIVGQLYANGSLDAILFKNSNAQWGEDTALDFEGSLLKVMGGNALAYDFENIKFRSVKEDLENFLPQELNISIPDIIVINAKGAGNLKAIHTEIALETTLGSAHLNADLDITELFELESQLVIEELQLGKLLQNEQLGVLSSSITLSGKGNNLNNLTAHLKGDFSRLQIKGYDYTGLHLEGKTLLGKGDILLSFKDENLDFESRTAVVLDSLNSKIHMDLNLKGADLLALGVIQKDVKLSSELNVNFEGNTDSFDITGGISQGVIVFEEGQYSIDKTDFSVSAHEDRTALEIKGTMLNASLLSNTSPEKSVAAIKNQLGSYLYDTQEVDATSASPVILDFKMLLRPEQFMNTGLVSGDTELDSITVAGDFNSATKSLNASLHIPHVAHESGTLDSLLVTITGDAYELVFSAGLAALAYDPLNIKKTSLQGSLKDKTLSFGFNSFDDTEKLMGVDGLFIFYSDSTSLSFDPSTLVFNKNKWTIPASNLLVFGKNRLQFQDMILERNGEKLAFTNGVSGIDEEHIGVFFENFRLQTFLGFLNPDKALARGVVKGNFILVNPFGASGVVADFDIGEFSVLENALGNLSLNASSEAFRDYEFNLALKDGGMDLDLNGDYVADVSGAQLHLDLKLNELQMHLLEGFTKGTIEDAKGALSGIIELRGTTVAPLYKGNLSFDDVSFKVAALNALLQIKNSTVEIANEQLAFKNFVVQDLNNNNFTVDGLVRFKEISNPAFDLEFKTNTFQLLNSGREDNELFYGTAVIDADIKVNGNLNQPKIDGNLKVREETKVTYVVPKSQLDMEETEGVVIFVNREEPNDILTRTKEEESTEAFKGIDLQAVIEVADNAVLNVVIDERSGDNLQVSGKADLSLNIDPNGIVGLSGRYVLNSGHYETSLYNLVKRRFEIEEGSTIVWRGNPLDADLNITTIYKVSAAASPLMTSLTSGQDANAVSKYRQVLPFWVYLNVEGQLVRPELSFALDMPQDEQGALGGAVYAQIRQLNTQESERNKQVFSLLTLNRFFPVSGSDGSSGGTASLARNNVNQVLSDELNTFSDRLMGNTGFDLDFDLDSFTDYQGENPQNRTQLNINAQKKLFNNRLIVTAGSALVVEGNAQQGAESAPIIGNISLEYLLTENGQYRLKGFQKNQFQNIIDGQLIVTGIALIFNREFNRFSELFAPTEEEEKETEKDTPATKVQKETGGKEKSKI